MTVEVVVGYSQMTLFLDQCTYYVSTWVIRSLGLWICHLVHAVSLCADSVVRKEYCSIELTEGKFKAFVYAIRNHYWYQMYLGESACLFETLGEGTTLWGEHEGASNA